MSKKNSLIKEYQRNRFINSKGQWINKDVIANKEILIVTVAYNNDNVIRYQSHLIKKYFIGTSNIGYLVVDNSSREESSEAIRKICVENDMTLVRLKHNPESSGSESHALCLDWVCKNINIFCGKIRIIGILDHDCFPIDYIDTVFLDTVEKQGFYGLRQDRGSYWYLWPGFCFFDLKKFNISRFEFKPNEKGDTGVQTGDMVRNHINEIGLNESDILFPEQVYVELMDRRVSEYTQDTCVEVFDNKFVHLMNGSNWLGTEVYHEKSKLVNDYLEQFL